MHKRTEITIETERYLVVGQNPEKTILWCKHCDKSVPMLTVSEAARIAGTTTSVISRLAKSGNLHFVVTPEGQLFICPNSRA